MLKATAVTLNPINAATHSALEPMLLTSRLTHKLCLCVYLIFSAVAGADLDTLSTSSLLAIMELHILPPVPVLLTPWTTPFFAANPSLPTWLGPNLTATKVSSG